MGCYLQLDLVLVLCEQLLRCSVSLVDDSMDLLVNDPVSCLGVALLIAALSAIVKSA